jgi:hypothetical protein
MRRQAETYLSLSHTLQDETANTFDYFDKCLPFAFPLTDVIATLKSHEQMGLINVVKPRRKKQQQPQQISTQERPMPHSLRSRSMNSAHS